MDIFSLYQDIQNRTGGEIYIGVVGPVRTGKSTFIKRFMELLVLPGMSDEVAREQAKDELPQAGSGKTIMTTEPKFIPKEAALVQLSGELEVKVRLIDCVGYMVEGATGHLEEGQERQVKTPWFDYEIPFTKAADIGTRKVIHDHSTVGILITTDGSVGEIAGENYKEAQEKTIRELKALGKPFIVLINTLHPYSEEARALAAQIQETEQVHALPVNCQQLKEEDVHKIMEELLLAFPISEVQFYVPKWIEMLPKEHEIKGELLLHIREILAKLNQLWDAVGGIATPNSIYLESMTVEEINPATGIIRIHLAVPNEYYYEVLSELTGATIGGEYELIRLIKELSALRQEYEKVNVAFSTVKLKGYGVVSPGKEEITLEEPVLIRQGNKFGVKIRSEAPSIHMIRAVIENEIAPIVGTEQQAKDLMEYIKQAGTQEDGMWNTSIFGKSLEDMVLDGMNSKIARINEESQSKLQDTMQKIVNDSNGGMVCIII